MNRWLLSANALLVLGLGAGVSQAQLPQIGGYNRPQTNPRPTVSPYLNFFRSNPAVNYYGIVRPQMETAHDLQQLQQQYQQIRAPGADLGYDQQQQQQQQQNLPITGQGFGGFFYYGHYYPALNRQGGQTTAPRFNIQQR